MVEALSQSHHRRRDCEIEVRQLFELEDFGESEAIDRFREMGLATQNSRRQAKSDEI